MTANDLFNLLSCYGPNENVQVDATGLRIGRNHVDIPVSADLVDLVARGAWSDDLAGDGLRVDL